MELVIGPDGKMRTGDGVCTDPVFVAPTLRCLAAQTFVPATDNGKAVTDRQHLEYEWRATTPPGRNLCASLRTS